MLTDAQIRKAKGTGKDYKLTDAQGLYLFVTKAGFRSWRLKYRFAGKERRLVIGGYPEVSLAEAREQREIARRQLREHRDPKIEREKTRAAAEADAAVTFEGTARAWHGTQLPRWSGDYGALVLRSLERDIFPSLGAIPLKDVTSPMVLAVLRKIEARGAIETARRIRQHVSAIFVYGISESTVSVDPAATLAKALKPVPRTVKQPSITDLEELRKFIRTMEACDRTGPIVKLASRFLALTVVRPGVLRQTPWGEFEGVDWDGTAIGPQRPLWRIPAERMKLDVHRKGDATFEHVVPLSHQAVDVLRAIRRITGRMPMVFPNGWSSHRPMSENAIRAAYIRLGYGGTHVPHGWRASFSTLMNERARKARRNERDIIDLMLAHVPEGTSGSEGAYNRAAYMERRREIAQEWADMILPGAPGANDLIGA